MTKSLNQIQDRLKAKDGKIGDLETIIARVEIIRMKLQPSASERLRNQAFGYGYGAALQRLKSFLVTNP